jgi:hypothetical protein
MGVTFQLDGVSQGIEYPLATSNINLGTINLKKKFLLAVVVTLLPTLYGL